MIEIFVRRRAICWLRSLSRFSLTVLVLAALGACQAAPRVSRTPGDLEQILNATPYPRASEVSQSEKTAELNRAAVRYVLERESRFYRNHNDAWPEGLPQFCISLSGGGLRAASTAIGALQGIAQLQSQGQLPQLDIASGVSGGAYALYWLYGEGLMQGVDLSNLLLGEVQPAALAGSEVSSEQIHNLDANASTISAKWFERQLQYVGVAGLYMMGQIFRLLPYWDDSFHIEGGVGSYYGSMLNRSFNSSNYKLFGPLSPKLTAIAQKIEAQGESQKQGYPVPIIGAAIRLNTQNPCSSTDANAEQSASIPWRYLEFTPFRIGSYATGYREPLDERLNVAVSASGAAPDAPTFASCEWLRAFGALTGVANAGFTPASDSIVNSPVLTKNGEWVVQQSTAELFASDGGFADNLAMFPTVSRMCRNTLVIDAAHDPYLQFQDLLQLQYNLRRYHSIDLDIPRAAEIAEKNRGPLPEMHVSPSKEDDSLDYKIHSAREECRRRNPSCLYADQLDSPIFAGGLSSASDGSGIPFAAPVSDGTTRTYFLWPSVTIIKLSLDHAQIGTFSKSVQNRYKAPVSGSDTCTAGHLPDLGRCYFPQEPTEDQSYEAGQFQAYRELGRSLVINNAAQIRASMAAARISTSPYGAR
jgi:hypothetical protein